MKPSHLTPKHEKKTNSDNLPFLPVFFYPKQTKTEVEGAQAIK